jgi:hypothetical protein
MAAAALTKWPGILGSEQLLVVIGKRAHNLQVKIVDHRRDGQELLHILLAGGIHPLLEREVEAPVFAPLAD